MRQWSEAAEVDAPPVVLETKKATVAVAKVSELSGAEMEVPGGAAIAFPAVGSLAGSADIKVVAFKGNPFESASDVELFHSGCGRFRGEGASHTRPPPAILF